MKAFICAITLLLLTQICSAQKVYQIRADSVRIYNTCDTAELIIENRTKDTLGFLYNKGNGRTEFRKLRLKAVNGNAIAIAGQDTLLMSNVIKVAVDTMYLTGNTLNYRRTNGELKSVILDLSTWGDTKYDLLSTNYKSIAAGTSILWDQWTTNKLAGYDAYNGAGMPKLSAQAFQGVGDTTYYNGLVYKSASTGFDMAVNWNGELSGPNGMFVRTKDDSKTVWSNWRELLFKDYADKSYANRVAVGTLTTGAGWYRIAINGPLVAGTASTATLAGSRASARFIITDITPGKHQTVEFIASVHFNEQPILKVISNSTYANYPFQAIRMVRRATGIGTYDGDAIEVLTNRTEALDVKAVILNNEQYSGWTAVGWQKITSSTGINDGLPAGFTQSSFDLTTAMVEGTTEGTGSYWRYIRGAGLQTTGGFRQRSYLGMVGNAVTDTTAQKIIWTIGDNNTTLANYTGIGYDYGNQTTFGTDNQFVIASNGVIAHRFNMAGGGVSLTGQLKVSGNVTAPGFYQSSLRSLKKDITAFNGDALMLISGLKIVEFTYKDDKDELRHTGIIADESDAHFSTKDHDKFDINSAVSITMKAVQELTEKLEQLNKRIEELENKMK
jgi:hypothetical protein